jgi:hypothetical protein
MRYMDMPGEEASGFHDRGLGLAGEDLMLHQHPTIEVPQTDFHLMYAPVRVPTVEGMTAMIPAWDNPAVSLGPFTDVVLKTEVVRPRNTQIVPDYLAALLVNGGAPQRCNSEGRVP